MAGNVTVDPRYLKYSTKAEVEALLDKVNNADAEPTAESENMIKSGAVHAALGNYATKQSVEDLAGAMPTLETNDDPASLLEDDSSDSE